MEDLDNIEKDLKEKDLKNKKIHRVSGKSVFKLQQIIQKKADKEEESGDSEKPVAGDE